MITFDVYVREKPECGYKVCHSFPEAFRCAKRLCEDNGVQPHEVVILQEVRFTLASLLEEKDGE